MRGYLINQELLFGFIPIYTASGTSGQILRCWSIRATLAQKQCLLNISLSHFLARPSSSSQERF